MTATAGSTGSTTAFNSTVGSTATAIPVGQNSSIRVCFQYSFEIIMVLICLLLNLNY